MNNLRRVVTSLLLLALLLGGWSQGLQVRAANDLTAAALLASQIRISQVYGGGGNSGATYTNDFVELFNAGTTPVEITGWTVQYASATGTTWQVTALNGTIQPGAYYLVQEAAGSGGTVPLPTPDATGTIAMSATAGKVALVAGTTALAGSCPLGAPVVDFVGFGATASCFEGTGPTSAPSNTLAVLRADGGCTDTDENAADFTAVAPAPRNSVSPVHLCGAPPLEPKINEFSASTADTDVEYIEIYGEANTDYSAYTLLEIEGDYAVPAVGTVDEVVAVETTNASGFYLASLVANSLENGTLTLLLVENFTGALGDDLDTDDNGSLDVTPWDAIIDSVAVNDGGVTDLAYGAPVLTVAYDGLPYAPGGASRIPDGADTESPSDWVRNDYDLAGIPSYTGTPVEGEALNTPGTTNVAYVTPEPKINEFSASTVGDDVEYIEIYGGPLADYSAYTLLHIEGDYNSTTPTVLGLVDQVIAVQVTDANGFYLSSLVTNTLENGTSSLLLVKDFTGSAGNDLDTNDDGVLDTTPWDSLVDSVAVHDGGASDLAYGTTVLTVAYDGLPFAPGGASRIPDGADTESTSDWVRNDFDLAGIPGYTGTIIVGEAYNTPGATNVAYTAPPEQCGDPYTATYEIQGSGLTTAMTGTEVSVEGVVVGDFQNNLLPDDGQLGGFHIQDFPGDGAATTSDGLFIYYSVSDVSVGDRVRARGTVAEYNGVTELTGVSQVWVCSSGNVITSTALALPVAAITDFEPFEGMLVTFPQELVISEYFNYDRYGEIVLTSQRQIQPTAVYTPGSPEQAALAAAHLLDRITLDDGRTTQNPDPAIHPNGEVFTMTNLFRGGDTVANVTGVIDYSFNLYRVQPTEGADYTPANPRPSAPEDVAGTLKVASFNVYNYFTTLDDGTPICGPSQDMDCRGANTAEELARQRAKLVSALVGIDSDIVGLIEIENHITDGPTADLVAGVNDVLGAGTYGYIATGPIGTDAIRVALIYRPGAVTPMGDFAILDSTVDPLFLDDYNRPVLAQSFRDNATGAVFTVAVNHLKSKGSDCNAVSDPDLGDGAGNCNLTRKAAVEAEVAWLATDPTGSGDPDFLVVGDLNSYDKEDPINVLIAAGYTDLLNAFQGEYAYSYVYDSQIGNLDYGLANSSLASQVTGTTAWHINADEPDLIDYDMSFKQPAQDAIYAPDAYRSSDHDAIIVGIEFVPEITLTKTATPAAVNLNEVLTYTIEIANTGGAADTVILTDTLPSEVSFLSWVDQPAGATLDAGEIHWTGTVGAGQTLTVRFTVTNLVAQATVSNTAYFNGTLQAGADTAIYVAGGWKVWLPLVFMNAAP